MNLFVTGGTGFFGRSLLDGVLATPAADRPRMTVLSRDPGRFLSRHPQYGALPIRWLEGDVQSFAGPTEAFDVVMHLATDVGVPGGQDRLRLFDAITEGTRRVLDFSRQCGAGRVLLASSGAVYGSQPPGVERLAESDSGPLDFTDPDQAYAMGKRAAEHLAGHYHRQFGLQVCVARCFAFVGPHLPLDAHFAIGNFMRSALRGEDIVVQGDGTPLRSYMHADDLVRWLWRIALDGVPMRPYNVGSDQPVSIADLAKKVALHAEKPVSVRVLKPAEPGKPPQRYIPSVARARAELGLNLTLDLDQAIAATMAWHRKN